MLEQILIPGTKLGEVEPGLFSVCEPDKRGAPYDSKVEYYDKMVSSKRYLKYAWGANVSTIRSFMVEAFDSGPGVIVDLAAGTSVDAVALYGKTNRPTIVVDLSLGMLRKGRQRLVSLCDEIPDHVSFLQADAYSLPFRPASVSTLLCHGAFHVLPSTEAVVAEWQRILGDAGSLFMSSLVKDRWFGRIYLAMLYRLGEVSWPKFATEVEALVNTGIDGEVRFETEGNFAYGRMVR